MPSLLLLSSAHATASDGDMAAAAAIVAARAGEVVVTGVGVPVFAAATAAADWSRFL
jgi:hypothetical protein